MKKIYGAKKVWIKDQLYFTGQVRVFYNGRFLYQITSDMKRLEKAQATTDSKYL